MSEFITVARPYAKAAFDLAVERQALDHWQGMLTFAAEISHIEQVRDMIVGVSAPEALASRFVAVCGEMLDEQGRNLIRVMAENRRLPALSDVLQLFVELRAQHEQTAEVDVTSAHPLEDQQLEKITLALEKKLSRRVKLNCNIDKSVIAGVVIRVGDMVIDGSIRGRLDRLADALQS